VTRTAADHRAEVAGVVRKRTSPCGS
jgi:hypothetical protein